MSEISNLPRVLTALLGGACFCATMTGCVSGSLASNTGPPLRGGVWADAPRQSVLVGETVQFDFVLQNLFRQVVQPLGTADYCVFRVGTTSMDDTADAHGHFQFSYDFEGYKPGDIVDVQVTAYQRIGNQDFMRVGDHWYRSESLFDAPDRRVARDKIQMTVYAPVIELDLPGDADAFDPTSGVLKIHRFDGSTTSVYLDRPGRPGFTLAPQGPDGRYRVRYIPSADQLNHVGTTPVDFSIHDVGGVAHYASVILETP